MILTKKQITEKLKNAEKPDNMTEGDWQDFKVNGTGPCNVLVGLDYCGEPSFCGMCDLIEATKPEDKVIHYDVIKLWRFCTENKRYP